MVPSDALRMAWPIWPGIASRSTISFDGGGGCATTGSPLAIDGGCAIAASDMMWEVAQRSRERTGR